ncbi:uncharacterized protein PSFLO_04855 [Pseudozyma flocculosa]|uniref:Uncharacterized protein n=1 Tax=Pseudozyma flocculosa TaxID=84751 RepID=A0A5C3F4E0_9BASI|nr:uncharacterized protein PSFLO_04855 [Pseudozyma flocculosa]
MKLPPRSLVKRLIRSHLPASARLSKNADLYIALAFLLYMQRLANETRLTHQIDLSNGIRGPLAKRHVAGARRRVRG